MEGLGGELTYNEHLFGAIYYKMWFIYSFIWSSQGLVKISVNIPVTYKQNELQSLCHCQTLICKFQVLEQWKLGQGLKCYLDVTSNP